MAKRTNPRTRPALPTGASYSIGVDGARLSLPIGRTARAHFMHDLRAYPDLRVTAVLVEALPGKQITYQELRAVRLQDAQRALEAFLAMERPRRSTRPLSDVALAQLAAERDALADEGKSDWIKRLAASHDRHDGTIRRQLRDAIERGWRDETGRLTKAGRALLDEANPTRERNP